MKKIITLSLVFLSLVAFNAEAKTKKENCKKAFKPKKFHAYLEKNAQFMFNNASEDIKFMLLNGQI
jgi:hypothetical protein